MLESWLFVPLMRSSIGSSLWTSKLLSRALLTHGFSRCFVICGLFHHLYEAIAAFFWRPRALINTITGFRYMYSVDTGVMQGCPLSGLLFVLAINPLLKHIQGSLSTEAILGACADDIGLEVPQDDLPRLCDAMQRVGLASNLFLNVSKCTFFEHIVQKVLFSR